MKKTTKIFDTNCFRLFQQCTFILTPKLTKFETGYRNQYREYIFVDIFGLPLTTFELKAFEL
jgi:hypothetical protein